MGAALPTCTPLPCSYSFPDGPGVEHNCSSASFGRDDDVGVAQNEAPGDTQI